MDGQHGKGRRLGTVGLGVLLVLGGVLLGEQTGAALTLLGALTLGLALVASYRREAELHDDLERYRRVLEGNHDGLWDWNLLTNGVFFSDRWKAMLGFAPSEIRADLSEWSSRVHPDDLDRVMQEVQDHLDGKTAYYVSEHRVRCKTGQYKWILDRGKALHQGGRVVRMVGSHTDIDDWKLAQAALQSSEARYRHLVGHLDAGVVMFDPQGEVLYCNEAARTLLGGSTPAEWDGQLVREDGTVLPAEAYPSRQVRTSMRALAGQVLGVQRREGGCVWLWVSGFPEFDGAGEFAQAVITLTNITPRIVMEEALRQAKAELERELVRSRALFEGSMDGIVVNDAQGRVVQASPSFAAMLGYSLAQVHRLTSTDWDLQWPALQADLDRPASTKQIETRLRRQDGTPCEVEVCCSCMVVDGQRLYYSVCRDVSDRKRAEAQQARTEARLRQSEATQNAIIRAIPDLLIRMGTDGSRLQWISGLSGSVVAAPRPQQATLPADLAQQRTHYVQRTLKTGDPHTYEQKLMVQGQPRYEEVRVVPLQPDEVLVMIRDITSRKQTEDDLRYQKDMFQAIIDHIPVMVTLFSAEGKVLLVNPETERVLGWPQQAWYEQDLIAQCYPDPAYRQQVIDHMARAAGDWADFTTCTATGEVITTSWANLALANGLFLGIGQDISDRVYKAQALQQAMAAAEAANQAKSQFLATMSHELRTPLNAILGFTQLLLRNPPLTPDQRQSLQTVQRSGEHLLALINDVLDFSKIEAGYAVLEEADFDLHGLLHTLLAMLQLRADAKGLTLTLDLAPTVPPYVTGDAQKLQQVLLNLLSNALKFTDSGGVILAARSCSTAGKPQPCLQFWVVDTGVGMANDEMATIFDAFVQAKAGRKALQGTGLGLAISYRLAHLMGGTLSVCSEVGAGSTFSLQVPLPAARAPDGAAGGDGTAPMLWSLDGPGQLRPSQYKILVVDDQATNRLVLVQLLRGVGFQVEDVSNGRVAVERWRTWRPHLIWMDLRMPGLDGYAATRQIRAQEQAEAVSPIPIIALSAQAQAQDRQAALAAGCNDYLSKPFHTPVLLQTMARHLAATVPASAPVAAVVSLGAPDLPPARLPPAPECRPAPRPDLSALPTPWLVALEDAATCGDDGAIHALAAELPPQQAALAQQLQTLAQQYQFERILHWLA